MCVCVWQFYLWCPGSDLGCFRELALAKEHVELAYKQLLSSSQVVTCSHTQGKVGITQCVGDIGDEVTIINTDREDL